MKLNDIKDKFDGREIQPSAGSWERLAVRLDKEKKTNKKPIIMWLGAVAAILVVALMVVPSFFGMDNTESTSPQLVVEEPMIEENSPTEKRTIDQDVPSTTLKNAVAQENSAKAIEKPAVPNMIKASSEPKEILGLKVIENNIIAAVATEEATVPKTDAQRSLEISQPNQKVSEADLLLNQALNRIGSKTTQETGVATRTGESISPQKLLRETEWDLEAQKRNRIENTLLDGLGRLKREAVALIDRNQ